VYDLRAQDQTKPITLNYKANVYQNSGYDWKNISLTVSTGIPTQNNNQPTLYPQYANIFEPVHLKHKATRQAYHSGNSRADDFESAVASEPMVAKMAEMDVVETTNTLSTTYAIQNKQSIQSNGKQHLVHITDYELPAKFKHFAVPKLDQTAFLVANISDWGQYNLLPANVNLFFEGGYVGQSYLDPTTSSDTLTVSLGADHKVNISRKEVKDKTDRQFIGFNTKEIHTYEIEVKNLKNTTIDIDIEDQIPVSKNDDIEIELLEASGAALDKETGKLTWKLKLDPNGQKTLRFSFEAKYPKNKNVTGL
jgi:uncharacterized protein (TIGR02231 family)